MNSTTNPLENKLQKLLGKQYLISGYIEKKLQIVNYIKQGYEDNVSILKSNRFLHFTAQVYYRSIIIDLHALFGKANNSNKNSFHFIENFASLLKTKSVSIFKEWIESYIEEISIIEDLRHKQMAHYDFSKKESISLNFNNLPQVNLLFNLAQKIICHFGNSLLDDASPIGYEFGREHHYLHSLQRLVKKAGG